MVVLGGFLRLILDHDSEDQGQKEQIKEDEDVLAFGHISAFVGQEVQQRVEPDEPGGIDQWAGLTLQEGIVEGGVVDDRLHFLHVGDPVDLGVLHSLHDQQVQEEFTNQQQTRHKSQVEFARFGGQGPHFGH